MGEWEKEMRAKLKRTKLCNKEREREEKGSLDARWTSLEHLLCIA